MLKAGTSADSPENRKKVLILGGGLGGLSAAYALTATQARRAAFEVTLATQGWRLGGKGASGRRKCAHQRIEEHGLHIFLGFYRTAFGVMREALEALDGPADGVFPDVEAAFRPARKVTLWISPSDPKAGKWQDYTLTAPEWPGRPWQPAETAEEALRRAPRRLAELMRDHAEPALAESLGRASPHEGHLTERLHRLRALVPEPQEDKFSPSFSPSELGHEIGGLFHEIGEGLETLVDEARIAAHLIYDLIEIGTAMLAGYLEDILPHGWDRFDVINDQDFRRWLMQHGASERAAWSEGIRTIYDLAFAYADGRTEKESASIAAGAALRLVFQMTAGYSHAPLWRMNAGMGDTICTPLYKLITRRGGRVAFFRRAAAIEADPQTGLIERVTLIRQAELAGAAYDPLTRVHELDCWPSEPHWEQLADGERLKADGVNFEDPWQHEEVDRIPLSRGRDFDHVILAIPPAAAAHLTGSLAAISPDWQRMLDRVGGASVATHSVQLWVDRTTAEMGWERPLTVSGAYAPPLGTWADMSHLIAQEDWSNGQPAKSCQYLVGVVELPLSTPAPTTKAPHFQRQQNELFAAESRSWLDAHAFRLWSESAVPGDFDLAQVVGDYDHVNIAPSELYVQTPPGSVVDRLPPGWDGVANLWLAGDWTTSSINGGSAEAAFESGKAAADALAAAEGVAGA